MCDVCYKSGIPVLPRELGELVERSVLSGWQERDGRYRVSIRGEWQSWLSGLEMRQWLDEKLSEAVRWLQEESA